jgi:hypothetical protein
MRSIALCEEHLTKQTHKNISDLTQIDRFIRTVPYLQYMSTAPMNYAKWTRSHLERHSRMKYSALNHEKCTDNFYSYSWFAVGGSSPRL